VTLSYRSDKFSRLKPKNRIKINEAIENNKIEVLLNSNLISINEKNVIINTAESEIPMEIDNDLVYIFAGGELPTAFLQKAGVEISKRFNYIMKKHG